MLAGIGVQDFAALVADIEVKAALLAQTDGSAACGVFGAQTCLVGDEMFVGQPGSVGSCAGGARLSARIAAAPPTASGPQRAGRVSGLARLPETKTPAIGGRFMVVENSSGAAAAGDGYRCQGSPD